MRDGDCKGYPTSIYQQSPESLPPARSVEREPEYEVGLTFQKRWYLVNENTIHRGQ